PGRGFRPSRHVTENDLAAQVHLSERRVFRVSFVRAAYGATGVKQNPGESSFGSFQNSSTISFYRIGLSKCTSMILDKAGEKA
ncbi:hypothetical protein HMPREF0322_04863, partial [Desulfitobacterium hafniense DP7]